MASTGQDFEVWQGDSLTLDVVVEGVADLTGLSLFWALADGPGRTPILQKTGGGGGITFTDNVMHVRLDSVDTVNLEAREYYHEAKVKDGAGNGDVVSIGTAHVRPASLKDV